MAVVLLALTVGLTRAQGPEPPVFPAGGGTEGSGPQATLGTAPSEVVGRNITYQGQLKKNGNPVNGACDFQFSLWDAADGGTQVGAPETRMGVQVSNGLFTIPDLDFPGAFHGEARWMQVAVKCTGDADYITLSPRQAITAVPYALGLRPGLIVVGSAGGPVFSAQNTGSGFTYGLHGLSTSTDGTGVTGWANASSGYTYGVSGFSASTEGTGVYGRAHAPSGTTYGVYGRSDSSAGHGVYGHATAASGETYGMYGRSDSSAGRGVYGHATAASGETYGVYGRSASTDGRGVFGEATAASGATYGVLGRSNSTGGRGMYGWAASATSGTTYGVLGRSDSSDGRGVYGVAYAASGETYGVYGASNSTSGRGVYGVANAASGETYGVYGESASNSGVGVYGWAASATSGTTYGVLGRSDSSDGRGVYGVAYAASGETYGVYGASNSTSGRGVYGVANAASGETYGVYGESASTSGSGVYGRATASSGVNCGVRGWSNSPSGFGVYGANINGGFAGYFWGDVYIYGNLYAIGSKSFKIDHPLDPANRYLYHFAQEAPEVQNVYNGIVTLDANGEATVTLPAYFAAINSGPFRYQLTAIGAPMPNLYVAQEIQGNTFRIAGGVPGKKVSWEVTAVRNDPYLRDHPVQAEVDKPTGEQGTYLYPEGYGQPPEMGLDYQRNARLRQP